MCLAGARRPRRLGPWFERTSATAGTRGPRGSQTPGECPMVVEPRLALEVLEHREDAAVIGRRRAEVELVEDVPDVLLHGGVADHEGLSDPAVGLPLRHRCENLALARAQQLERPA